MSSSPAPPPLPLLDSSPSCDACFDEKKPRPCRISRQELLTALKDSELKLQYFNQRNFCIVCDHAIGFHASAPAVVAHFANGLPPLGNRNGATSPSSTSEARHPAAKFKQGKFNLLANMTLTAAPGIWSQHQTGGLESWGSESDIQGFVKIVLTDAIFAVGLKNRLHCFNELSVFSIRPDIWIVVNNRGVPVGVCEVKTPGSSIMESDIIHGQIFDYMLQLRSFHGLKHVFGIVSTYKQWRIYWLNDKNCRNAAASAILQPPAGAISARVKERKENEKILTKLDFNPSNRIVCGSKIYEWNDSGLPRALCSVLLKMYSSPYCEVKLLDLNRPYIVIDGSQWSWSTFLFCNSPDTFLNYSRIPTKQSSKFILLRDLRAGADGRVWMACTEAGLVGVLKFPKHNDLAQADLEATVWREVWGQAGARAVSLANHAALLMPYVEPVTLDADGKPTELFLIETAVRTAVQRMAEAGYCHKDLHWRHVGKFPKPLNSGDHFEIVLFDLGRVEKMESAAAISFMLDSLKLPAAADADDISTALGVMKVSHVGS
jgi:hypothetical protein